MNWLDQELIDWGTFKEEKTFLKLIKKQLAEEFKKKKSLMYSRYMFGDFNASTKEEELDKILRLRYAQAVANSLGLKDSKKAFFVELRIQKCWDIINNEFLFNEYHDLFEPIYNEISKAIPWYQIVRLIKKGMTPRQMKRLFNLIRFRENRMEFRSALVYTRFHRFRYIDWFEDILKHIRYTHIRKFEEFMRIFKYTYRISTNITSRYLDVLNKLNEQTLRYTVTDSRNWKNDTVDNPNCFRLLTIVKTAKEWEPVRISDKTHRVWKIKFNRIPKDKKVRDLPVELINAFTKKKFSIFVKAYNERKGMLGWADDHAVLALAKTIAWLGKDWLLYVNDHYMHIHEFGINLPNVPFENGIKFLRKCRKTSIEIEPSIILNNWNKLEEAGIDPLKISLAELKQRFNTLELENIEDTEFAEEYAKWDRTQKRFEVAQDIWMNRHEAITYESIPYITIERGDWKFYRLSRDDVRALFLGKYTNCCQHIIKGAGLSCAIVGTTDPDSGFVVLEHKGKIKFQSWIWRYKDLLVFDNIEGSCKKELEREARNIYIEGMKAFIGQLGIKEVLIGTGNGKMDFLISYKQTPIEIMEFWSLFKNYKSLCNRYAQLESEKNVYSDTVNNVWFLSDILEYMKLLETKFDYNKLYYTTEPPKETIDDEPINFVSFEKIYKLFYSFEEPENKYIYTVKIPKDSFVRFEYGRYRTNEVVYTDKITLDEYFYNFDQNKENIPPEEYHSLAMFCQKYFDIWFDPKVFPTEHYHYLARYCNEHFNKWFDKNRYPIEDYKYLIEHCSEHIKEWFDPEILKNEDWMYSLVTKCGDTLDYWFDSKLFTPEGYHYLAIYENKKFNTWFDKNVFPKTHWRYLVEYCQDYFDEWFDPEYIEELSWGTLACRYKDKFNKWFDPETFPVSEYETLIKCNPDKFDEWFDPETFPKDCYKYLLEYCADRFDDWFNPENISTNMFKKLIIEYRKYFDLWYNPETFPVKYYKLLAKHYPNKFNEWFNGKRFPKQDYRYLAKYCYEYLKYWNTKESKNTVYRNLAIYQPDKFNEWYDKKVYPISEYSYLAEHCSNKFDEWFDKKTWPEKLYHMLAKHCPDKFDEWYDKDLYPEDEYVLLAEHCNEHFDKWFNPKTYPETDYFWLARYCKNHFNKWFDPNKICKDTYADIIKYIPEKFNDWFDTEIFRHFSHRILAMLEDYCPEYEDKWREVVL